MCIVYALTEAGKGMTSAGRALLDKQTVEGHACAASRYRRSQHRTGLLAKPLGDMFAGISARSDCNRALHGDGRNDEIAALYSVSSQLVFLYSHPLCRRFRR
ncbi:unnamed protein product [Cercospora beticola]|nr:unnamed protein product [Cercospora beticola]